MLHKFSFLDWEYYQLAPFSGGVEGGGESVFPPSLFAWRSTSKGEHTQALLPQIIWWTKVIRAQVVKPGYTVLSYMFSVIWFERMEYFELRFTDNGNRHNNSEYHWSINVLFLCESRRRPLLPRVEHETNMSRMIFLSLLLYKLSAF